MFDRNTWLLIIFVALVACGLLRMFYKSRKKKNAVKKLDNALQQESKIKSEQRKPKPASQQKSASTSNSDQKRRQEEGARRHQETVRNDPSQ